MSRLADGLLFATLGLIALGCVVAAAVPIYLAVWWQPDCAAQQARGKECRDWPWEKIG